MYERPREKLRSRGERALSTVELLQIIIGSGTKKVSGARIAKSVARLLSDQSSLAFQQLVAISGLGEAKACQIIASIELGRRLMSDSSTTRQAVSLAPELNKVSASTKRILEYTTVDGAGVNIKTRTEAFHEPSTMRSVIRGLFANALHDKANSIVVTIGSRRESFETLDSALLSALKGIFETADLLEIYVNSVELVNQTIRKQFRRKALS